MREPISLKDIFAIIIKRGRMIICFMVVFALLLGIYSVLRGRSATTSADLAYQAQLESYNQAKEQLESELENTKALYERTKAYIEKSPVMQLEPYDLYKSISVFLITVTEGSDSKTPTSTLEDLAYIASVIQHCYQLYWNTSDLGDALGMDMENQYLQEVVLLEGTTSGALVLSVYGNTKETVETLADKAGAFLLSMRDPVFESSYRHEISKFNQIVEHSSNSTFAEHQKNIREELTAYKESIKELEQQLNTLPIPAQSNASISLASIAKWAILGAFAGLALGCVWALVAFVMFARTESSRQMEAALGIPYLGTTAKPGNSFHRLAGRIMGETQWNTGEQATAFVAENLRATGVQDGLAIITTLRAKDASVALEQAAQALKPVCGDIRFAVDAQSNGSAIELLRQSKYLLIAERTSKSDVPKMLWLLNTAKRLGVTVLGFITI